MKLNLDGMSYEQAVALAKWYERFGEQVADEWLQEHGVRAPLVDVRAKDRCVTTEDAVILKVR